MNRESASDHRRPARPTPELSGDEVVNNGKSIATPNMSPYTHSPNSPELPDTTSPHQIPSNRVENAYNNACTDFSDLLAYVRSNGPSPNVQHDYINKDQLEQFWFLYLQVNTGGQRLLDLTKKYAEKKLKNTARSLYPKKGAKSKGGKGASQQ